MKKLIIISILSLFIFSCSDDKEEKYRWEVYIENTESISCLKPIIIKNYPTVSESDIDKIIQSGKSADLCLYGEDSKITTKEEGILGYASSTYCDRTEDQIKIYIQYLNDLMQKRYNEGEIDCPVIYTYRKVEPN